MQKSDLKDQMCCELRNGLRWLVCGDKLLNEQNGFIPLNCYNDSLIDDYNLKELDIIRVFEVDNFNGGITKALNDAKQVLWVREDKIDWNKVPRWTRIQYEELGTWINAYFIKDNITDYISETIPNGFNVKNIRLYDSNDLKAEWLYDN